MGNKNKTISFRVNEDAFEALRDIAEERDLSLSAVFRDYVDSLITHDGKIRVVPQDQAEAVDSEFPPKVMVPKSFVREHERLELEAKHLRAQLDEHKAYINALRERLDSDDDVEEVIHLDELDDELETNDPLDEQFTIG
ncbi:DMSO reductase family type II enzyme [Halanaeroarchaeum sp. HSR-CO]|uniref:CopG family transcriptional regulator n=1 Tax=Halanaeroarchaeum sp. HSR-CO TaxID=2866382 RepID=UPI00217ECEC4|nr:CopG family transcriptional regulator [Halanaeroarchaeum sp. HSR-CO]UWG46526.1 DMSO reductase family type II enzyme [Halanaeroarchaeum sp. HSR-CO]